MLVAFIVFFILFVALGVITLTGRFNSFITGNKVDEEGNPVYNDKAVAEFLGIVMFMLAFSALLGALGYLIPGASFLVICAPVIFIAVMIFALVYGSKEGRFKKRRRARRYRASRYRK
ncbi:MAG: DUF3784 domain-containing protein [Eubacteriales bacterium]|nr:DUF3784 domain-containing protein [Eubacteriales bacterium]